MLIIASFVSLMKNLNENNVFEGDVNKDFVNNLRRNES